MAKEISLKDIVGEELLNKIQDSYMQYLNSSAAIYELNGDYAAAIFSSKYCNFLNQAPQKMAGKTDQESLKSGKWICYEDCWAISRKAIKDKEPCEAECSGGIIIFAVPIIAEDMVIGSNNAGVSNPPTDEKKIKEIAERYKVDPKELLKIAEEYTPRPEWVLNAAKNHISVAADTIADIFLRRQAEAKSSQLSRAVEFGPSIITITDAKGNIEYINPKFTELTGYTSKEAIGKNPRFLKSGELAREIYEQLWQTIIAGKEWRGEFHNKKKSGELYWEAASISSLKDAKGNITHFVKVGEDITARKKAEKALLKSKEELATIFNNVPIFMALIDQGYHVRKANHVAVEFSDRPEEEMVGLSGGEAFRCLHSLDDLKGCGFGPSCKTCVERHTVADTFKTGKNHYRVEGTLPFRRGGKLVDITFLISTIIIDISGEKMVLVCLEDITGQKKSGNELKRKMHDLETFHKIVVGRELKMVELKERIANLEKGKNEK